LARLLRIRRLAPQGSPQGNQGKRQQQPAGGLKAIGDMAGKLDPCWQLMPLECREFINNENLSPFDIHFDLIWE
jgi:hypothetical protein